MNKKSNLDEMQEQKLLQIEHNGCWLCFAALLIAILAESILWGFEWKIVVGEWCVFMLLSVYLMVACIHAGIWDRKLKMNTRTNFLVSLIAAVIFGGFLFLAGILRFHKPTGSLIAAGIGTGLVFFGCWVALSIAAAMTKKRQAALEAEPDEEC